jgi:hypothetical protein
MRMEALPKLLRDHVTLVVESVDRVYLNAFVPQLQHSGGIYRWLRDVRGQPIPSPALLGKIGDGFVKAMERFAKERGVPLEPFPRGVRKEEHVRPHFAGAEAEDRFGVVFVGTAQEKARSYRGVRTAEGKASGQPWFEFKPSEVFVKWFYVYIRDQEFGPCFVKLCTYAPFTGRLCVNGHEWAKRQLAKAGIAFEALDNGFASCADPKRLQAVCDRFGPHHIAALWRRCLAVIPQPFSAEDQRAGYRHVLSVLQAEFSLTHVFDQPRRGRSFFEHVIRENLDLGRPDRVALLWQKRVTRRTGGTWSTRVITEGVQPSLHAEFKHSHVKQYFKEGRALRTETTINDTYDIGVQRALKNLPALITYGRALNRRLLAAEEDAATCMADMERIDGVLLPTEVDGQRVPALRFGDPRACALEAALCLFRLGPLAATGFRSADLRELVPVLRGDPTSYSPAQATYDLRRLRLKGLIERIPKTHRYRVTGKGVRLMMALVKLQGQVLPALCSDRAMQERLGPLGRRLADQLGRCFAALSA